MSDALDCTRIPVVLAFEREIMKIQASVARGIDGATSHEDAVALIASFRHQAGKKLQEACIDASPLLVATLEEVVARKTRYAELGWTRLLSERAHMWTPTDAPQQSQSVPFLN